MRHFKVMPIKHTLAIVAVGALSLMALNAGAASLKKKATPSTKTKRYAQNETAEKGFHVTEVGKKGIFITSKASAVIDYSNGQDGAIIVEGLRLLDGKLERHISTKNRAVINKDMNLYWGGPDLVVLFREDLVTVKK